MMPKIDGSTSARSDVPVIERRAVDPASVFIRGTDSLPLPPHPARVQRRSLSPFNIIVFLLGLAIAIVLYVSNVIAVNQLLHDINALETEHRQLLMEQERLKAQLHRLASLERIQERAEAELGLKSLREPPVWLELDHQKLRDVNERLAEDRETRNEP